MSTFGDGGMGGATTSTLYGDLDYGGASGACVALFTPTDTTGSSVILELDDGRQLALDSTEMGWVVTKVDPGMPVPRTVSQDRPMGDGTFDSTRHVGGRTVLIDVTLMSENRLAQRDALAPYMRPSTTLNLYVRFEIGGGYRKLRVKPSPQSFPWERPGGISSVLGWRTVGSPFWTSPDTVTATAFPDEVKPGRTYPRTYNRSYPSAAGIGPASLINRGTEPAEWVARIFGPVTAPRLINASTGQQVAFKSGFSIASGDFLTVNSTTRTAWLNGDSGASRYGQIDFALTTDGWFRIEPGQNLIRLSGSAYLIPAQAEISFSDTYQ